MENRDAHEMITGLQINLGHSKMASSLLNDTVRSSEYLFVLVQEPYVVHGDIGCITRDINCFHSGSNTSKTAVLLTDRLMGALQLYASDLLVLVQVPSGSGDIVLGSAYCAPSIGMDVLIDEITGQASLFRGKQVILGGDFNAKHSLWGSVVTDSRGEQLVEFMLSEGLAVLNIGSQGPTFRGTQGSSRIDLTLHKNFGPDMCMEWEILEEESGSDHCYIGITLGAPKVEAVKEARYKDKVDLRRLKALFKEEIITMGQEEGTPDVNELVNGLTTKISELCARVLKPRSISSSLGQLRWWSEDLALRRRQLRAARRRFQRSSGEERQTNRIRYKRLRAIYQREIELSKKRAWESWGDKLTTKDPYGAQYRLAAGKLIRPVKIAAQVREDGSKTSNLNETLDHILRAHFADDDRHAETEHHANTRRLVETARLGTDDVPFTVVEVDEIIRALPKQKAPGRDKISSRIVQALHEAQPILHVTIFNLCLQQGIFPNLWKEAQVVLFNNVGKDTSKSNSYRPICLLSVWGKVLDKLMTNRVNHFLGRAEALHPNQFGFRKGRSTCDALRSLTSEIREQLAIGHHVLLVSLDIQGAFNNVWWESVLAELGRLGCPSNLFRLIRDYFNGRSAILQVGNSVVRRRYTKGCPQGSCSGPLFWNLVANTALQMRFEEGIRLQAFADDFLLLVSAESRSRLEEKVNRALVGLTQWSCNQKLSFSLEKTLAMWFQKPGRGRRMRAREESRRYPHEPKIIFNGMRVKLVHEMRVLGVILDDHLTWVPHFAHLKKKCVALTYHLTRLLRGGEGVRCDVLKILYKHCIERMLLYGAPVWWNGTVKQKQKLLALQRVPLIAITRAYRTASTAALLTVAGLEPLFLVAKREVDWFRFQKDGTPLRMSNILVHRGDIQEEVDRSVEHPADRISLKWDAAKPQGRGIEIYTDGSKLDGRVGSGVCVSQRTGFPLARSYRLSDTASVFDAELVAIREATRWLEECEGVQEVDIFTDSQSALSALADSGNRSQIVNTIQSRITALGARMVIRLHWIRGHSGIPGNDKADELAKQGTRKDIVDFVIGISVKVLKAKLKQESRTDWQHWWDESDTGRHTHRLVPKVSSRLISDNFYITQFVTGHGNFPFYLRRFNIKNVGCPCGKLDTDVFHYLGECDHVVSLQAGIDTLQKLISCALGRERLVTVGKQLEGLNFVQLN